MKTYTTEITEIVRLDSVKCNKCGRVCKKASAPDFVYDTHYMSVKWRWGYGADNLELDMDLCEPCVFEFVKTFKIDPVIRPY